MSGAPDMIETSGREYMTLAERAALLELEAGRFARRRVTAFAAGRNLVGLLRAVAESLRARPSYPQWQEMRRAATAAMSRAECLALAWHRAGLVGYAEALRAQAARRGAPAATGA